MDFAPFTKTATANGEENDDSTKELLFWKHVEYIENHGKVFMPGNSLLITFLNKYCFDKGSRRL